MTAEANKIDNALAERFSERPNEYTPTTELMPVNMPSGRFYFIAPRRLPYNYIIYIIYLGNFYEYLNYLQLYNQY